jgi:HSP20 family protein
MQLVRFSPMTQGTALPRMDVIDRQDHLVVRLELPGVSGEDLDITVEDRTLSIAGTRSFEEETGYRRREIPTGRFTRTVLLPKGLDSQAITATIVDGILEVSIPRRPEVLPRKVKVDVAAS